MALSADQRAVLQLLLERGQSYANLSSMLDVEETEVRRRARSALRELADADLDRDVGLTDYLLGQADPIGRADVVRHLRENLDDHALVAEIAAELRELFPAAQLPRLPGEPRPPGRLRRRLPEVGRAQQRSSGAGPAPARLSPRQTRLVVALASGAILLIAVVLGITGVFGGGEDSNGETTTANSEPPGDELTRVELVPPRGGDATGLAIFGLATNDQPFVDLNIEGLNTAPNGETYVVWLMLTAEEGYPLAPITVNQRGTFRDQFAIPSTVLPIVARVRRVDISLAPVRDVGREIRRAISGEKLVLEKPGETVLAGDVPVVEAPAGGDAAGGGVDGG